MSKINKITLSNFKFFGKEDSINLDGKHLLLYGENGSGKSSIYWGLYTLLESAMKDSVDVQKYFEPDNAESLVNIYAQRIIDAQTQIEHAYSYINIETDNNQIYSLSLLRNNVCGVPGVQESRKASDFINYQSIYKFQDFRNSKTPDLYEVFVHSVLPYVNFASIEFKGRPLSNAGDMWKNYMEGPGTIHNQKGDVIQVYKNSPAYTQFLNFERHFHREFIRLIDFINNAAQENVRKLGYDIEFHLEFIPATHKKGDSKYYYTPFQINLIITKYNNVPVHINRPQTFLNEAKMSAIATAIRLSVIDFRINSIAEDALKVLILDDLMISLDMSNRNQLLKLLLKEYTTNYQLIFLTHDRSLFDCVMNHLSEDDLSKEWSILEMYETAMGNMRRPVIQSYLSPLSKAYMYFKGIDCIIDYNACGNNQRQALEEIFKKQFDLYSLRRDSGELVQTNGLMIAECISWAHLMYTQIGFDINLLDELDIYRKQSLNPTSHHNPQSNFYKSELLRTFEIIHTLEQYKIEKLVPVDEIIFLIVECSDGSIYNYQIQLLDAILVYKMPTGNYFIQENDKRKYCIKKCNDTECNHQTNGLTLAELYNETLAGIISHLHKTPIRQDNPISAFSYMGTNIHELLNAKNRI